MSKLSAGAQPQSREGWGLARFSDTSMNITNCRWGLPHNATLFPVSADPKSCTQSTAFGNIKFGGSNERILSLIDTIGFDDPDNDTDIKIIAELVDKLKNNVDFVNLFIIAVNGQEPRLDGSLVAMIKIFEVNMVFVISIKICNCMYCVIVVL